MYMKARQDLEIGCDLTPQILPLSWALCDSLLPSRCSACFSQLTTNTNNNNINNYPCSAYCRGSVNYCTKQCRNADIHTHIQSGECHLLNLIKNSPQSHDDTCDLRAALRLLRHHQSSGSLPNSSNSPNSRIGNLITNHHQLVGRRNKSLSNSGCEDDSDWGSDEDEMAQRIQGGARLMHLSRKNAGASSGSHGHCDGDVCRMEEEVLCQVITNGVEVQVDEEVPTRGSGVFPGELQCLVLGTAVYGVMFSWCNHSCRPNACYRFVLKKGRVVGLEDQQKMVAENGVLIEPGDDFSTNSLVEENREHKVYGPGAILRTTRRVSKGEEVFITYTDLLQPKETRELELWLKYRFGCHCERCNTPMLSYIDWILQEQNNINMTCSSSENDNNETRAVEALMDDIKCGMDDFISKGDPDICCETLENALGKIIAPKGFVTSDNQLWSGESLFRIHPLHHLCIDAYTVLASAYRLRANDALHCGLNKHHFVSGEFDPSMSGSSAFTTADNVQMISGDHDHDCLSSSSSNSFGKGQSVNLTSQTGNDSGLTGPLDSEALARENNCNCLPNAAMKDTESIKASENNKAAAAYTLLLAGAVNHFFLAGEQSLIMTVGRFWITTGEALLTWILGCGFQTYILETDCHSIRQHSMFGSMWQSVRCDCIFLNNNIGSMRMLLQCKNGCASGSFCKEDLANVYGYHAFLRASTSFLRCMNKFVNLLWPSMQFGITYLEAIPNPLDYGWLSCSQRYPLLDCILVHDKVEEKDDENEDGNIHVDLKKWNSSSSSLGILESRCVSDKDGAFHSSMKKEKLFAIECAVHCFYYSKYLLEICYGSSHPLVYYIENILQFIS